MTLSPNTNINTPAAIGLVSNLYLVITLNAGKAYATKHAQGPFFINVVGAVCNCLKARWTAPTIGTLRVNVALNNNNYVLPALASVTASVNTSNSSPDADSAEMRAC